MSNCRLIAKCTDGEDDSCEFYQRGKKYQCVFQYGELCLNHKCIEQSLTSLKEKNDHLLTVLGVAHD